MKNIPNYVKDKVIIITGAAGAFGGLVSRKLAAMGGKIVMADIKEDNLKTAVEEIKTSGGEATYTVTDVTNRDQMFAMAEYAKNTYGRIDVLVNNAGTMPVSFMADHKIAWEAWDLCINIGIHGTLYGIEAVYDTMIEQGCGQIINISSIWGNSPAKGAAAYVATKAAVRYLTESLSKETRGKIKTTVVRPTGISTGLMTTIVNSDGNVGILQDEFENWKERAKLRMEGKAPAEASDVNSIQLWSLPADYLADNIVYVINQPWGVNISDITIRASGDLFML